MTDFQRNFQILAQILKRAVLPMILLATLTASAHETENNLIPVLRFFLNPALSENTDAFSFLGEAGEKNFRGNATYGRTFDPCQRFKLSAEFLMQKLKYRFSNRISDKWVSQIGFGGKYQYLFSQSPFIGIDADFSYSRAFKRNVAKTNINSFTVERQRISGSNALFSSLGTTLRLWDCGFISAGADYDWIDFNHIAHHKIVNGFGASVAFRQEFGMDFNLILETEFRRPFNFYQTALNWNPSYSNWGLTCGLYGNYTQGKRHLPNIASAGVQLGFTFGGKSNCCCRSSTCCTTKVSCDLSNWVLQPAFYSPIVLAIPEDSITTNLSGMCHPPTSTEIPQLNTNADPYSVNISGFFKSSLSLTFSVVGLPPGSSIDPVTGVISGPNPHDGIHTLTVTATSACGSTSQNFDLNLF